MTNYQIRTSLFATIFILFQSIASAQIDRLHINPEYNQLIWADFAEKLEADNNLSIFWPEDSLGEVRVQLDFSQMTANEALKNFLDELGYSALIQNRNLFVVPHGQLNIGLPASYFQSEYYGFVDSETARNEFFTSGETYIPLERTVGQKGEDKKEYATFSGYVRNSYDGGSVAGAVMNIEETGSTEVTDESGFYSFTLKKGTYTLNISSVEVEPAVITVHLLSSGSMNIELNRKYVALDEVLISSDDFHNVKSMNMGFEKLSTFKSAEIPSSIGENDIVKAGLLLPGIQSVGEGSAGINVRGSPADQNMFYLDRLPVYNTSHFLGFFSSFNAAAIDEFTIYKAGIPAEYNGSPASIAEIKAKEGNKKNFSAAGGISPISANIQAEGPIIQDKASYMFSLRSSYSNWIFNMVNNPILNKSSASFRDFTGKISWDVNQKNKLKLLGYHSSDHSNLKGENIYDYRTTGGGIEWNRIIAGKHNLNTSLVHSDYGFTEQNFQQRLYAYEIPYGLQHSELSSKLNLKLNEKHKLTLGANLTYYKIEGGEAAPANNQSLLASVDFKDEKAFLAGMFLSEEWKVFDDLKIKGSFRLNNYRYLGPASVFRYSQEGLFTETNVADTVTYGNFESVRSMIHPDFRFSANYKIGDLFSVKAGASNMYQYLFMMSNTIAVSPVDKWKLADAHLNPVRGNQYSAGLYFNSKDGIFEASAEVYYKDISHFKDYKEGANIVFSRVPEFDILEGDLDAYGIEIMFKKVRGRLNGWINYSYSRARVQTQSVFPEQQANMGRPYPASYDKPHAFNFVGNYKFGRRLSVSSNLVYSSGRPITYPVGVFYSDDTQYLNYSGRNEFRIPDYFRIDFSVKLEGNLKADKAAHGTWVLSVYNLTGRDNVYSVFFRTEEGEINSYKMSIFAEPVITLSYQFKLGNYADKYH